MIDQRVPTLGRMNPEKASLGRSVSSRDYAYDFTKGFLVQVMIAFHSIQYFVGLHQIELNYLDFVTGGFVLLAGAAVTRFYLQKYDQQPALMLRRLLIRGAKLVLLFALLNTCVHAFIKKNYNGVEFGVRHFFDHAFEVFIPGSKQLSCFEILLPIGYTLMLAGVLVSALRSTVGRVALIVTLFALSCIWVAAPFNVRFTAIGLSGVLIGYLRNVDLIPRTRRIAVAALLVLVAGYALSITWLEQDNLWLYFIGVASVVQFVSLSAEDLNFDTRLVKAIVLFGRYSLFSYLFQILLLQLLLRILGTELLGKSEAILPMLATNGALYVVVVALESLRARHKFVNGSYRLVFA